MCYKQIYIYRDRHSVTWSVLPYALSTYFIIYFVSYEIPYDGQGGCDLYFMFVHIKQVIGLIGV